MKNKAKLTLDATNRLILVNFNENLTKISIDSDLDINEIFDYVYFYSQTVDLSRISESQFVNSIKSSILEV
jgi:hypothetical protein